MNSKVLNWIFGIIAIAAIGAAVYIYVSNYSNQPVSVATPSATTTPSAAPSTDMGMISSSASPSPSVATTRTLTTRDPLSVPNQVVTLSAGESLSTLAAEVNISSTSLANLNGVSDPNKVYAGQTIVMPDDVGVGSYTILFVTNNNRLQTETARIAGGSASIYSDPVSAVQNDAKGIYGLTVSTPYSVNGDPTKDTTLTLSSTDTTKSVTVTVTKVGSSLWAISKLVIQVTATPAPTASP